MAAAAANEATATARGDTPTAEEGGQRGNKCKTEGRKGTYNDDGGGDDDTI